MRNHPILVRVVAGVILLGAIVAYLRLMLDVTARPVVPYQVASVATPMPTPEPTPTLTAVQRSAPRGAFDFPEDSSTVVGGETQVRGWALDVGTDTGSGVDRVQLFLDGTYLQDAEYGQARPDIGAVYGAQFENSGWVALLDLSQKPFGNHQLEARTHSTLSDQATGYATRIVLAPRPSTVRAMIDFPAASDAVAGVTEVRGWALDETAEQGTGVDRVTVYLDGALLAEADTGQARPDIAAGYGPRFERAGWRAAVDPGSVGPGSHQLEARVHSTVDDRETSYSTTIVVAQ